MKQADYLNLITHTLKKRTLHIVETLMCQSIWFCFETSFEMSSSTGKKITKPFRSSQDIQYLRSDDVCNKTYISAIRFSKSRTRKKIYQ